MAIALNNEDAQKHLNGKIKELTKKYDISQDLTDAIIQFEYVRQGQFKKHRYREPIETGCNSWLRQGSQIFCKNWRRNAAGRIITVSAKHWKPEYTFYCTHMVIFKNPCGMKKNMPLKDCFLVCSTDNGLQYYQIGEKDKEINEDGSGIKILDNVCGCKNNLCSLPEFYNIRGPCYENWRSGFSKHIITSKMANIKEIYANVKDEIIPGVNNISSPDNGLFGKTPTKLLEDMRYIA